jgi:uncharacterized protein YecT (DUF1311 family)
MLKRYGLRQLVSILLALGMLTTVPAGALDNPDAPNVVVEFEQRAKPFEDKIGEHAGSGAVAAHYADYERFLDDELNHAYAALMKKIEPPRKQQLLHSQKAWLAFRDAEFAFIRDNWTQQQFGSSSSLSRGAYRSMVAKDRITALLNYLKNYR